MNTSDIRQLFLDYYQKLDHKIVPSCSLVPLDDPSLLFTSAGMVQFKKIFLGQEISKYKRITTCQRCLRAGGKHNDLENVGFTSRHHTFFEMLGNFSFGDYFKLEAIKYAWEFITKHLKIPETKLWITVYEQDPEAENIWLNEIKIDASRFSRCNAEENFWAMGDTGPCGPCTEIYYDYGSDFVGDPPGIGDPGERYIEIYNLVFMQYNRTVNGNLDPLPHPCVDTGMGLERVAAIMQGVHGNYDIDIFVKLIKDLANLLKIKDLNHSSLKVIADHLRACSFLVADGILPSNEGRGYVLRRIMRRAIRHGYKLGRKEPFFHLAVSSLIKVMGQDFPLLKEHQLKITEIFLLEELQFAKTLDNGMKLLSQNLINCKANNLSFVPGEIIFKLYDTYGFPVDLTMDILRENNLQADLLGFQECMSNQKARARSTAKFKDLELASNVAETQFVGYEHDLATSKIVAIFSNQVEQNEVVTISRGQQGRIVLDTTPFYAEAGGQVGDIGELYNQHGKFKVTDTQKVGNTNFHIGEVIEGIFKVGDQITASIDIERRNKIRANHSATHLLQAALKNILGKHIVQKGSLVDATKLRFDFEHFQPLTKDQLREIELQINKKIYSNQNVVTKIMPITEAINQGAVALFAEKYQEEVRVLDIAQGFSMELCGGTHVNRTGDIGCFKIINEDGVASGIRRIEAVTGEEAIKFNALNKELIDNLVKTCKVPDPFYIEEYMGKLQQKNKDLEKQIEILAKKNVLLQIEQIKSKSINIGEIKIVIAEVDFSFNNFKYAVDLLKQSLGTAIIVLGASSDSKVNLIVGLTKNLLSKDCSDLGGKFNLTATDLIKDLASMVDGKGGGRPDLAEASGTNINGLSKALDFCYHRIVNDLKQS